MNTVKIKLNDTAIDFTTTLLVDGSPVDLTGATVLFLIRLIKSPNTAYSFTATVVSAIAGTVIYTTGVGFPVVAGQYSQEWQVTFSDGSILTFPSRGYNTVIILDDLN